MNSQHSWAFGLVSPDLQIRQMTLDYHLQMLHEQSKALRYYNRYWNTRGPDRDAASALLSKATNSLWGSSWFGVNFLDPDAVNRILPYMLLFLRWENLYPDVWRTSWNWSPFGNKEVVLRDLRRAGPTIRGNHELGQLIVEAVARPYRCKDWKYAWLVRGQDGQVLRGGLRPLAQQENSRAQYLLWLLENPSAPVNIGSYPRWLVQRQPDPSRTH